MHGIGVKVAVSIRSYCWWKDAMTRPAVCAVRRQAVSWALEVLQPIWASIQVVSSQSPARGLVPR